jgi:hypothetical protein
MTTDRRFTEREIALILEQAGAAQELVQELAGPEAAAANLPAGQGLTLGQLQEIGRDVGIAPEHISNAAQAVSRGDLVPTRAQRWLGLPIGVSRTVDFGRPVDDAEWDRLVVLLRETFHATGRIDRSGNFREWRNGNLHALLEPTATGHRLRLTTRKGNAAARLAIGLVTLATAGIMVTMQLSEGLGSTPTEYVLPAILAALGALNIGVTAFGLPTWARTRAAQMQLIAERSSQPA